MEKKIIEILTQMETKRGIKVLFACESGSRAWGYSHEGSDYDVRFIYIHTPSWYLAIDQQKDFIELPASEKIDMTGWELQKCLRLYRKSNPGILEWLYSSHIYCEPFSAAGKLRDYAKKRLSPVPCLHHYLHMAERNFYKKNDAALKSLFNILRPLLAAKWIEEHHLFPPVSFALLIEETLTKGIVQSEVLDLLSKKMQGEQTVTRSALLDRFIEAEIKRLLPKLKNMESKQNNKDITPELNALFYDSLKEVWGDRF